MKTVCASSVRAAGHRTTFLVLLALSVIVRQQERELARTRLGFTSGDLESECGSSRTFCRSQLKPLILCSHPP